MPGTVTIAGTAEDGADVPGGATGDWPAAVKERVAATASETQASDDFTGMIEEWVCLKRRRRRIVSMPRDGALDRQDRFANDRLDAERAELGVRSPRIALHAVRRCA